MVEYDVLIVGAGLFGSVLADCLSKYNKNVLIVEKESKPGGTVATENINGITVHLHGAHIFRTNLEFIWDYVNELCHFEPFINTPIAIHDNCSYNLPFNMNTFSKLWNITTPEEAKNIIQQQIADYGLSGEPKNLEEYALSTVGKDIYEAFIRDYTEKQWNKPCSSLPVATMRRIPIRYTYNNNYYNCKYQGIPNAGYSTLIRRLLNHNNITLLCGIDGKSFVTNNPNIAKTIVYTGCIDEFFNYKFGRLEYRSLKFETSVIDTDDYQGVAVVNYSDLTVPYTRSIEHKHFLNQKSAVTVVTKEYPQDYNGKNIPYYPIESDENIVRYRQYLKLVPDNMMFAGRLGSYKYISMDETVDKAMSLAANLLR